MGNPVPFKVHLLMTQVIFHKVFISSIITVLSAAKDGILHLVLICHFCLFVPLSVFLELKRNCTKINK